MSVRWVLIAAVFVYLFGALGVFIRTVGGDDFNRKERYMIAAAEESLLWPVALARLAAKQLKE